LRNTYARATELSGFPDPSEFFKVVAKDWQPQQPAEPPPDPAMLVAQVEQQKGAAEVAKMQHGQQIDEQKLEIEREKVLLQREKQQQENEREIMKIQSNEAIALRELELKYSLEGEKARMDAEIKRQTAEASHEVAATVAGHNVGLAERAQDHKEQIDYTKLEQPAAGGQ
jgi:hypothetical protein